MIKIAVFASGAGSNAQKIIEHFKNNIAIEVALVVCNKPGAGITHIAQNKNIPVLLIEKEKFFRGDAYINELHDAQISFIILAGFLWKIPLALVHAYKNKIINIHPALLPKYGGKGMYGANVHNAVLQAGEKQSGISIHIVDELYDHGKTIFQTTCPVLQTDTAETLAQRIHVLEHMHFSTVIENYIIDFMVNQPKE